MRPKHVLIQMFDDYLNTILPNVEIWDYSFLPADVLKSTDPIAYREELLNWADHECNQGFITQQEYDSL